MSCRLVAAVLATTLALAGCSGDTGPGTDTDADPGGEGDLVEVPGVVTSAGSVAFDGQALRIVAPAVLPTCRKMTVGRSSLVM